MVAAPSPWLGRAEQLVLVGNLDQPQVCFEPGEAVGAVLPPWPASPPGAVAHVSQDWEELQDFAELEMPTE
eukprot:3327641-Lingulodinium_polyedra.AAC.1